MLQVVNVNIRKLVSSNPSVFKATPTQFDNWLRTPLGARLVDYEMGALKQWLPHHYLPAAAQIGATALPALSLCESRLKIQISPSVGEPKEGEGGEFPLALANPEALPLAPQSVDMIILPHTLEFCPQPHDILREVNETVTADGYLLVTGFNPYSWWGVKKKIGFRRKTYWAGHLYSVSRIQDWLSLLGFEIRGARYLFHRPPISNHAIFRRLGFMEKAGDRWFSIFGGVYILLAKKRMMRVSPIPQRRKSLHAFRPHLVQPVANRNS